MVFVSFFEECKNININKSLGVWRVNMDLLMVNNLIK